MAYNRSNAGSAALEFARKLTGKPYIYGGTWPQSGGTDCDGLVVWAYAQVGITLVRPTETTYREYPLDDRSVPNEVGDLLFIPGDPIDANPGHVVMFVSPGQCIEAEETGTLIGQKPFATDSWEFRTRPALALPEPPPIIEEDPDMGVIAISNGKVKGDWWVRGHNRCNLNGPQAAALVALGIQKKTLTDAEIECFSIVGWSGI